VFEWRRELAILGPVVLLGQLDVWWVSASDAGWGIRALEAVAVLAFGLLLLLRHRDPMATLVAMAVLACLTALIVERRAFFFGQLVPYLIVVSATAGALRRRDRVRGLALSFVAFAPLVALVPALQGEGNLVTYAVVIPGAWGIGHVLGEHARRADALAALAQAREEETARAAQAERDRLSRELHDIVAHNVGVIVLHAVAALAAANDEHAGPAVQRPLETIEATAREALDEMRRLVAMLDSGAPDGASGRVAQLEPLVERIRSAGLRVELAIEGEPCVLPAAIDLSAYRIVQESLTNALKHAGRSSVRVRLRYDLRALAIEVCDDGPGVSVPALGRGGRGLVGMRERVSLLGGTFEAGPRASGGFSVCAELPLAT
jgi:signal transduction histidine kinase